MGNMTIKDIAKKCGVGVSTVSRAMNNHPDINPETKEKILKTIAQSNYVPNNSARNLKRTDTKAIAVLVKGIGNTFFSDLVSGLERECQYMNYSCILQHVEEQEDELDIALHITKEKKLRGLVFLGGNLSHPKEKMEQLEVPYVLSTIRTSDMEDKKYAAVSVDDFKESYKMTEYLIHLGHKKIAILTAPKEDKSIGKLRLLGYQKALRDYGIPYSEKLVSYMDAEEDRYSFRSGYKLTRQLLMDTEFTALYATSDTMAIGACRALKEAGISVPGQCSVAGFDGMDTGEFYIPSITTIRQPVEQIAKATADLLFDMINGKEKPRQLIFEGELVERESTIPPADKEKQSSNGTMKREK